MLAKNEPRARRTRAKAAARPQRVLALEWRVWAAENLARGATRDEVLAGLRSGGTPRAEAERRIDEIIASPAFVAARSLGRQLRRHELLVGLQQATLATAPRTIPRRRGVRARELLDHHYATNTPVILTDLVTRWPAYRRWTPEYLAEHVGSARLMVTMDRESDPDYDMRTKEHSRPIRLRDFVAMIRARPRSNDFYAVAQNQNIDRPALRPLWKDVRFDRALLDPKRLRGCAALWLGPAGTITPLHHDTSNILFCQIHGRKRFTLAPPFETAMWKGQKSFYAQPGRPDAFPDVRFLTIDLAPGEALFLPVGWWHHVEALDVSISLAFTNFTRANWYDWYRPGDV
jgi:hypothetical protein